MTEAKKCASRLLGCYRTGDAHDPEIYISAVVSVLAQYPTDVMRDVTEPSSGLPSRLNWLPTIAEIKKACEERYSHVRWAQEWEANAAKQLAERRPLQIADRRPRKTYEQLQAELAEVGIFIGTKGGSMPKALDIKGFYTGHGLTKEQWDAIPNQPNESG